MFHVPNRYRLRDGLLKSSEEYGNNGAFMLPAPTKNRGKGAARLQVVASDGAGWEHVSVSRLDKTPTWEDMCFVKDIFWDEEDVVIQYHPPKSQYVNNHKYCLHLWRPTVGVIQVPDAILVGLREIGEL